MNRRALWRAAAIGTVTTVALATVPPASAAEPVSQSAARIIDGQLGGQPLATLIELVGVTAENFGGAAVEKTESPDVALLNNAISLPLGDALGNLPTQDLLQLGVLQQTANAYPNGSANSAASVASVGLDLADLGGGALSDVIGDLQLGLGAVQANAQQASGKNGQQSGSCNVAGLTLDLESELLADIFNQLAGVTGLADQIGTALNDALGNLNIPGVLAVEIDGLANLPELTNDLLTINIGNGGLVVDLQNGTLRVDLAKLLEIPGLNLCNLGENVNVINALVDALTEILPAAIQTIVNDLIAEINEVVDNLGITVTVAGTPIELSPEQLAVLLDPLQDTVNDVLDQLQDVLSTVNLNVQPILDLLSSIVEIVVNVKESEGGTFTQEAIRLNLGAPTDTPLPIPGRAGARAVEDPAVSLTLARAQVGPGTPLDDPEDPRDPRDPRNPIINAGESDPANGPLVWVGTGLLVLGGAYLLVSPGRRRTDS